MGIDPGQHISPEIPDSHVPAGRLDPSRIIQHLDSVKTALPVPEGFHQLSGPVPGTAVHQHHLDLLPGIGLPADICK